MDTDALAQLARPDVDMPIPAYMLNPHTGRAIKTDNNHNRRILGLPPLPRKGRSDVGRPHKYPKEKRAGYRKRMSDREKRRLAGVALEDMSQDSERGSGDDTESEDDANDAELEALAQLNHSEEVQDPEKPNKHPPKESAEVPTMVTETVIAANKGMAGRVFPRDYADRLREAAKKARE